MTKNMQNKQDNVSMLLMKRTDSIAYNVFGLGVSATLHEL